MLNPDQKSFIGKIEKYLFFIAFFGLAYLAVYNLTVKRNVLADPVLEKKVDSLFLSNKKLDSDLYFLNHKIDSIAAIVLTKKEKIKTLKKHEASALSSTDTLDGNELFNSFSEFKP